MPMEFAWILKRANEIAIKLIATYLAVLSSRTPWQPKLAAGLVVGVTAVASELARAFTPASLFPTVFGIFGFCLAVATIDRLVPPDLMSQFRAEAGGIKVQSHVRAYFELLALALAAATAFAAWHFLWPLLAG